MPELLHHLWGHDRARYTGVNPCEVCHFPSGRGGQSVELAGNEAEKLIECNELQKSPIPTPNNNLGEVAYRLLWMLTLQDA